MALRQETEQAGRRLKHSHPCITAGNTRGKRPTISKRVSAFVASVIAMLCAFALVLPADMAMAADPPEANSPSETTPQPDESGIPGTSTGTPDSSSNPGNSNEQSKPATPAQPAPSTQPTQPTTPSQNGSSKSSSSNRQTSPTTPHASNRSSSTSGKSTSSQNAATNDSQDDTASTSTTSSDDDKTAKITIESSTPVVTSTSGYHLTATIENTGDATIAAGTLTVSANDSYTFASRSNLQQWAQGNSRIQTPNQLGQVAVAQIAKGSKTSVNIDADPNQPSLKNMTSWGPKPVRIDYTFPANPNDNGSGSASSSTTSTKTIHTFLTRSNDGLSSASTPPLNITIAMPLTSNSWQTDNDKLTQFMTTGEGDTAKIVNAGKLPQATDQLISKHPGLQVITDPTLAQSLSVPPASSGIMQPGDFDITTYSALNDGAAYEKAGVTAKAWNAETGVQEFRSALGDTKANPTIYAWPGRGQWTMASLQTAVQQGYSTVIALDTSAAGNSNTNSTIHTGKYIIHTSAGDVTVLTAQDVLSTLAQGKPTDKTVDGESSAAGRLARFMAQSAFYQMESPYADRNLLVCFDIGTATSEDAAEDASTLMQTVEQAPWLKLSSLNDLNQSTAYLSGEKAVALVPSSPNIHVSVLNRMRQTLAGLAASKNDIDRFSTSILDESSAKSSTGSDAQSGQSGSSSGSGSGSNSGASSGSESGGAASGKSSQSADSNTSSSDADKSDKSNKSDASSNASSSTLANGTNNANGGGNASNKTDTGDVQALARQDADTTAKRSKNGCDWITAIATMQNTMALHALSSDNAVAKRMTASAQNLASQLMNGITITPSESITVLSESAKMPVTVSNNHPYPVTVKISSLSDSMEIVTTRFVTLSIPARSEAQTTFTVRVSTSGTATAHLSLMDRNGEEFSTPQSTRITSALRLSDMSGIIFIAIALVLGVIGLWRQFNRKKDPDE
ncbi:DUF6049 family protein [Bifidobacterium sp. ESL0682]|uniref:DUF6049 family protein n=1 Tax=Bifidobacterium sp. ESL0682 TaxID=2983212 RepID=UPI0023F71DE6|nr:DUF6049 family protein [Bifidobacterium sp. ESL0682]WEV42014.1 DUF6049 family protein [Bifidobacterium sp. ESL0682]